MRNYTRTHKHTSHSITTVSDKIKSTRLWLKNRRTTCLLVFKEDHVSENACMATRFAANVSRVPNGRLKRWKMLLKTQEVQIYTIKYGKTRWRFAYILRALLNNWVGLRIQSVAYPAQNFERGPNILTLIERQYLAWDTTSKSTKRQAILEICGGMTHLSSLNTPMVAVVGVLLSRLWARKYAPWKMVTS